MASPLVAADFYERLDRLALVSRRRLLGFGKGDRRSLRRGTSLEFVDYRPYTSGDDPRQVDWNIYGRLDRLHVKLFVDEEDLCLHLLVDASASMGFGAPSKLDYAVRLAAALGFVGLVNHERVGLGVLRQRVSEGWPPTRGRSQILPMMSFLADVRAAVGDGPAINACGGISSAADAVACIDAGATTVQIYSALIYEGPGVLGELTSALPRRERVLRGQ